MNQIIATLEMSEIVFGKIDKFVKFSEHLTREIENDTKFAQYFRGENYVTDLLKFLLEEETIDHKEYADLQAHSIEVTIFYILQMLLQKEVLFSYDAEADTPQSAITTLYAWQAYERLGVLLNKKIIPYPFTKKETLRITDMRYMVDEELEQETLEVISILSQGSYIPENQNYASENATVLDDYLNLLHRKGILNQDELILAISSDDIENIIASMIHSKIFEAKKLPDSVIRKAFYQYYDKFIKIRQEETKGKVDSILEEEQDIDYDEYPFLHLLSYGVTILLNPRDMGGELIDFDFYTLIQFFAEYNILSPNQAQDIIDTLENDGEADKYQIIFSLFKAFYRSSFIEEIEIDEDDRIRFTGELNRQYYALNMLYD